MLVKTKHNSIVMLLSNPAAESKAWCIFLIYEESFQGVVSGNDQFSSPEPPWPAGIKAWCDTFLSVNLVQLNPEAMNLFLTRNRQTSPAVEKCLRNNTWMSEVLRLHSRWECRWRKQFDLWVCRPLRWAHKPKNWDCHLHADLLCAHNDSAFLFSYCDVHSTPVQWYRVLCFSPSSLWGHDGVDKEGHPGVLLLKAIASLFISGFVQKGGHARYLVQTCLW